MEPHFARLFLTATVPRHSFRPLLTLTYSLVLMKLASKCISSTSYETRFEIHFFGKPGNTRSDVWTTLNVPDLAKASELWFCGCSSAFRDGADPKSSRRCPQWPSSSKSVTNPCRQRTFGSVRWTFKHGKASGPKLQNNVTCNCMRATTPVLQLVIRVL